MKKYSTLKTYKPLKRGNGFKKTTSTLKRSGFKRTLNEEQKAIKEADQKFSKAIRNRDGKCLRCGSTSFLTCSHYHGISIFSTRYDPLNCVTFCTVCHQEWESKKNTDYKEFMVNWLGIHQFNLLSARSKLIISPIEAIEAYSYFFTQGDDIQY